MQRYFVQLSYNGGAYHGWQIQPSGISVQEVLNKAFSTILRKPDFSLTGAGRTDAGYRRRKRGRFTESTGRINTADGLFALHKSKVCVQFSC